MLNFDESLLAEFACQNIDLLWTSYMDYASEYIITTDSLYILHMSKQESVGLRHKSLVMGPLSSENRILKLKRRKPLLKSQKPIEIILKISKDWEKNNKIRIKDQKIFIYLHVFMLLSHFFIEAFPNYENSPDKPWECKSYFVFIFLS